MHYRYNKSFGIEHVLEYVSEILILCHCHGLYYYMHGWDLYFVDINLTGCEHPLQQRGLTSFVK